MHRARGLLPLLLAFGAGARRNYTGVTALHVKVGKTAGSSVKAFIIRNNLYDSIAFVHLNPVARRLQAPTRCVISTRDPVQRVISAHKFCNVDGGYEHLRPVRKACAAACEAHSTIAFPT
jgi:hypothetical protein